MRLALIVVMLFLPLIAAQGQELGGYTNMTYDPQHGTQIEYLSDNGRSYLWYPGNRSVLPGYWKRNADQLCFQYGANTYNPATGHSGGGWECMPLALYVQAIAQRAHGDLFGLAERDRAPFRLDRRKTTLEKLAGRLGN